MKTVLKINNRYSRTALFIIAFILTFGIGSVTALTLYADDIIYNPSNPDFAVDDAQTALDTLYELSSSSYEDGFNDAFNYHFRVSISCSYSFGNDSDGWTSGPKTASYYIDYNGGTVTTCTLNSPVYTTYGTQKSGVSLSNANVVINGKDDFTATFNLVSHLQVGHTGSRSHTVTVKYDHGNTTYTFNSLSWGSGSYTINLKSGGSPTVTLY